MTYIILAAGKGTSLQPLTLKTPKTLYRLNNEQTILQRMVSLIRKHDSDAEIVVVGGFLFDDIKKELEDLNAVLIRNPFYAITNSIVSLWFARAFLQKDNVTILNGDIVVEEKLIKEVITKPTKKPYVLVDSTLKNINKYSVQAQGDKICVMSRNLQNCFAQYMCVTKLDGVSARFLLNEIEDLVNREMVDLLFEDALVSMIFSRNFELYYKDAKNYKIAEIDCVDDLIEAKKVQSLD